MNEDNKGEEGNEPVGLPENLEPEATGADIQRESKEESQGVLTTDVIKVEQKLADESGVVTSTTEKVSEKVMESESGIGNSDGNSTNSVIRTEVLTTTTVVSTSTTAEIVRLEGSESSKILSPIEQSDKVSRR